MSSSNGMVPKPSRHIDAVLALEVEPPWSGRVRRDGEQVPFRRAPRRSRLVDTQKSSSTMTPPAVR